MRVYDKALEMNRKLAPIGLKGGNREVRFHTALGSAREVRACLDAAAAWGCTAARDAEVTRVVDELIGMLVNLVRAR